MARKKTSKSLKKDDFSITENEDICYFTEEAKPEGERVAVFSFDDPAPEPIQETESDNAEVNNPVSSVSHYFELPKSSQKLLDNIQTKVDFGSLPSIDGEPASVRRSYGLRHSTVVKIDAIKNAHSKTCVSVSTVVDMAIAYYYDCIFKK